MPSPNASALLATLDDTRRLYRLEAQGVLAELKIQAWSLREVLGEPWLMDVVCLATDPRLNLDAMLRQQVSVMTRLSDGREVRRTGVVLEAIAEHSDGGFARFRLIVRPWLAKLRFSTHSRAWQDQSVVDIIDAIFATYPDATWTWADDVAQHLALSPYSDARGERPVRPYCVQYRETDLAFVTRLLAEEGLNLRFGDDRNRVIVFADSTRIDSCPDDESSAVGTLGTPGIRYHRDAPVEDQDAILDFGASRKLPAHEVYVLAWDHENKRTTVATAPTMTEWGSGHAPQLQDYDPTTAHLFRDNQAARRAAELMQQAREAHHKSWIGRSTVRSFTPGRSFVLHDSPLDRLDALKGGEDRRPFP